ncbi:MAG: GNAT family N-acetyltransferase [bacterium]|nr:GNAT family N-acetyltransferase [bacterium]
MVSLTVSDPSTNASDEYPIRPVNLRTDLAALADLIEIAFAESMDSNGRAAIREMRALSHMGTLTSLVSANNDLLQGMGMGYVWIADGKLVGNVSIYPASLPPGGARWYGGAVWLIANVATHPAYRGRGIARRLMETSLNAIRKRARGGRVTVLLQVDAANQVARGLYESLGFTSERLWNHWRRSSLSRIASAPADPAIYITQRRRGEWQAEYRLAQRARPPERGGVGWLRPTFPGLFRPSLAKTVNDFFNLRSTERLVIRSENGEMRAALWVESALAASSLNLTLMVDPAYTGLYDQALIAYAARRFGARSSLSIEHPADEPMTNTLLTRYHFQIQRTFVNMRWTA